MARIFHGCTDCSQPRLDDIARKTFLRKLQVIRKRKITSIDAWHEYELKRL